MRVTSIRYENATPEAVIEAMERALTPAITYDVSDVPVMDVSKPITRKIYHAVDAFGNDARHHVARSSWMQFYNAGMIQVHMGPYARDAKTTLGDPRALPYLKDILSPANQIALPNDVIIWSNSDIGFAPGLIEALMPNLDQCGATSMRRTESNGQNHVGRDLFAFTGKWLTDHWEEIPDYIIGVPVFDLGLVAMIRKHAGVAIPTTVKNVALDYGPADTQPGYALHQSHISEWLVRDHYNLPATVHNRENFFAWAKRYAPETRFSKGHNLL